MADETDAKRRINRTLTQKYDMHSLRALQNLESAFMEKLAGVYGCDEEDVPVELDLLRVFNDEPESRRASITESLKGAPGDVSQLIDQLLLEIEKLDTAKK